MNTPEHSLLDLIALGGPIMWALVALSALGLVLFIERALFLHRAQIRSSQFLDGVKNSVRKRRVVEAITVAEETPGPVAVVVKSALAHHDAPEARIRFAITEAALAEIPALERRIGSLAAVAHAAPVLGLLGTVLGLIQTFHRFEQGGNYATASALSGGMWQALLTTAAGLAIAVAGRLAHHFLTGRVRALIYDMEWASNDLLQFLLVERRNETAAAETESAPREAERETAPARRT